MASTLLASTAIMLCSLVAMLMTDKTPAQPPPPPLQQQQQRQQQETEIFPDMNYNFSLKPFSILSCFLIAFLMNVQSIRFYNHASILINARRSSLLTPEYVAAMVNRGSYFWSIGLRAFYFSFPLFLWIFGSVPMFLCCVALVAMLRLLDVTFHGMVAAEGGEREEQEADDNTLRITMPSA